MTKPLTHALPYMVGMLLGNWLSAQPSSQHRLAQEQATKRAVTTLLGLIATMVALAEVFLPYKWNNSHLPTRFLAALYAALFRFGWSLVLAYVVISCRHRRGRSCRDDKLAGRGTDCRRCERQKSSIVMVESVPDKVGWIGQVERKLDENRASLSGPSQVQWCMCGSGGSLLNRLLSWSIFTHLSKLSFTAYLIHLPLMSVFIAQTRGLFAFSHTLVIHLALSYLVMTFILSFLLVHIIELPFITFERYLFDKWFYAARKGVVSGGQEFKNGSDEAGIRKTTTKNALFNLESDGSISIVGEQVKKTDKPMISNDGMLIKDQSGNHLNYVISERL